MYRLRLFPSLLLVCVSQLATGAAAAFLVLCTCASGFVVVIFIVVVLVAVLVAAVNVVHLVLVVHLLVANFVVVHFVVVHVAVYLVDAASVVVVAVVRVLMNNYFSPVLVCQMRMRKTCS